MTKNVKERPIIFSGPMVRAILEGRKTQTRRIIRPNHLPFVENITGEYSSGNCGKRPFPYGKVGDRLWVRETFAMGDEHGKYDAPPDDGRPHYPTSDPHIRAWYKATEPYLDTSECGWSSSIHMPRWASRINLEITGIRIERLRDISETDAIAEGAQRFDSLPSIHPFGQDPRWSMESPKSTEQCLGSARMAYANYWGKLGNSWNENPRVWVIEFRRIEE